MIKLIICFLLLSGVAEAMDVSDPLTKPLPTSSRRLRLAPLQRTGVAVIGGLPPASKMAKSGKKVTFSMANLTQKLSERDLVSPDVTTVYNRDKSAVGFLATGDELIESVSKYGQIRRLRAAKPGTQLQTLRASMTNEMGISSSPSAFSGVIFSPKARASGVQTGKTSVSKGHASTYRPRILNNISSETVVSDEELLPVSELMRTADMLGDSDRDE